MLHPEAQNEGRIVKDDLSKRDSPGDLLQVTDKPQGADSPEAALASDETTTRRQLQELQDHQVILERQVAASTAELTRYRNYLMTFLDNLPMLAWLKDTEGRFLMVNQHFAEAAGRSGQEIIGLTDLDVWPRELAEAYRADDRKVMASQTRKQVEEGIESVRGGDWFETFKSPLIDSGGEVLGTVGIARDITERKQAYEKMAELEARYRIVADNTYDWEYWLSPDKTAFVYVSPSCKRITGYDAAEFLNDPGLFSRIIHPDDRQLVDLHLEERNQDKRSYELEFRIVRSDGEERWIGHACQPVFGDSADYLGTRGSNRDITIRKQAEEALHRAYDELELRVKERTGELTTANEYLHEEMQERKKAEEALRESSLRFKMVLDGLDALVYVADMDTYQILLVNRYGREIWGDLTGEICWQRLQSGQAGPCHFCTNSRLLDASGAPAEPVVWEFRNTVTGRWYECRDQAIRWTDGRLVRMEIATDITERKRTEAELLSLNAELEQRVRQRTAQIEAVNKELEAFSFTVSHDLRTPLVWIGGYSRSILKRYADRLDEQAHQYLREICEGALHMENLIDDLLDFSRLAYHELRQESVDLSALVRTVAAELAQAEPERRATFRIADGVIVDGDPHLLLVALKNLLGNAWKYTGKREEAIIEFGVARRREKRVCFVRDNGAGFDMALAAKLFIPFQRLHGTDEFKGHGIGLATVRRIIRHHDGEVWAESRQGEGTTFYFTLGTGE